MKLKTRVLNSVFTATTLLLMVLMQTACTTKSMETVSRDVPARIIAVNNSSRAELKRIVASALKRSSILLAGDALTNSNVLIIESSRLFGLNANKHQAINERAKPSVFRLVKSGENCILILQGTKKRWTLRNTQCEALDRVQ